MTKKTAKKPAPQPTKIHIPAVIGAALIAATLMSITVYLVYQIARPRPLAATLAPMPDITTQSDQAANPNAGYLVITEFGLRLKLSSNIEDLTYTYVPATSQNYDGHAVATLSSKSLASSDGSCIGDTASLGTIYRYSPGEQITLSDSERQPIDQVSGVFHSGSYYYLYVLGQSSCAAGNSIAQTVISQQLPYVRSSAATLEIVR